MLDLWTVMEAEITQSELTKLSQNEAIIERGLKTFVDVGQALLTIRDGKLYRRDYGTFEDYCRERWGMSDRRARMMIDASETMATLKTGTIVPVYPQTESQARPLTSLPPEQQAAAWQQAVENVSNWTQTLPSTESQARPLTSLPPEQQAAATKKPPL